MGSEQNAGTRLVVEDQPLNTHGTFRLSADPSDDTAAIVVDVFTGAQHRPCLALVAGVHGNEYDGIRALQQLTQEIDAATLQGSIVIIPVANPRAFAAAQRMTPQDNVDLNRVFPGDKSGSWTHQHAYLLVNDVLKQTDLVFTLHGARQEGSLSPWIEFRDHADAVGRASYEAALHSGFPNLVALSKEPGVLLTAMGNVGVPLIEGEVGGRGETANELVQYYKARAYAVAAHLGVIDPDVQPAPTSSDVPNIEPKIWNLNDILAETSGIFLNCVQLEQSVKAGDVLGTVIDSSGNTVQTVRSPKDGVIGYLREHAGVRANDMLYVLWTRATPAVRG